MDWERLSILAFVWLLISYEAITYVWQFGSIVYIEQPALFYTIMPLFVVIVLMICVCYCKTIVTGPGNPSPDVNDMYDNQNEIRDHAKHIQQLRKRLKNCDISSEQKIEQKIDQIELLQHVSWCLKCEKIKQVRVHHCKMCQQCILRMDHHCPWVGNCVGKHNHKYFIQFLLYATIGLFMISFHIFVDYVSGQTIANHYSDITRMNLYACAISSCALTISIGFLFGMQIRCVALNLTTIQTYVDGIQQVKPWQKSSFTQNMQEIFGQSSWFLPTRPFSSVNLLNSSQLG